MLLLHVIFFQSVEINPVFANGMCGPLSSDYRMTRVCDLGGMMESPVPCLQDIKKSYAIWLVQCWKFSQEYFVS